MHAFEIVLRTMGVQVGNQFASQICYNSGSHLLSHTVSSAVPSAAWVLTNVFGMGTGVSPKRIATRNLWAIDNSTAKQPLLILP